MNTNAKIPSSKQNKHGQNQVSKRCFDPIPKKRNPPTCGGVAKSHPAINRPLRYDTMAANIVSSVLTSMFIDLNNETSVGWQSPATGDILDEIHSAMLSYPAHGGGVFADHMAANGMRLVVAIVDNPGLWHESQDLRGQHTRFDNSQPIYVQRFQVLAHSRESGAGHDVLVPDPRWNIARRKFSLPGGNAVLGPYLALAMVEQGTELAVRARLWPVWHPSNMATFAIARSNFEREGRDSLHGIGGVACTPSRISEMAELQAGLGHRWAGDLVAYGYLPDLIIMPAPGALVTVFELFGLRGFKKYEVGMRKKKATGEFLDAQGKIRFASIDAKKSGGKSVTALAFESFGSAKEIWTPSKHLLIPA